MARLLVVEDEIHAREALGEVFSADYDVVLTADVEEAEAAFREAVPDLVLTDVVLPGSRDGLDLLRWIKEKAPGVPVIVMTAYGTVEKAVRAMRMGAHDFLEKPLDLGQLRALVEATFRRTRPRPELAPSPGIPEGIVGTAPALQEVFRVVARAAPTNATVLLLGESGTGKELVAEALHRQSPRAEGPLVKVNCAALSEGLLESELFGHVKGAFTGALADREGRFEAASGGTLFLDEVGEVPLHTQVKLLRALQSREVERVGESLPRRVDVRLVAATNVDLDARVRRGVFREDFYFRLKVITIRMPALRDRRSDIPALVEHFCRLYARRHNLPIPALTPEALALLKAHEWPGNVRELENTIEAALVLGAGSPIDPSLLPEEIGGAQRLDDLPETEGSIRIPAGTPLPEAERRIIMSTLERTGGNKTAAARILGIGLRTLYRKLEQYEAEAGHKSARS